MYIEVDIALLELEEEVDLSVYTPVCLPSSVRNRDNTPALAIGKGRVHLISFILCNCDKIERKLRFIKFPQEPSPRNYHNYDPGWGRTAGFLEKRKKLCNSTG